MAIDTGPRPASAPPPAARPTLPPPSTPSRRRAVLLPVVLLLVAASLRLVNLGHPDRIYFDETYYANDARSYLQEGVEEEFAVHPPLGKWLIAAGIAATGFQPFGWRVASAVAGTLLVGLTYLIGLRLFRRRGVAALAALLLCVDGLAFTMSRIAMLDIFLALFVAAGVWLLLLDRDRQWAGVTGDTPPRGSLPVRPHVFRWLAGVAFGLALATKWSAVLGLGAAAAFVLASELAWRRRLTGRITAGLWRAVGSGVLTLAVVPTLVYLASYASWFASFEHTRAGERLCPAEGGCEVSVPLMAAEWWGEQAEIARFHRDLRADHPYRAPATGWLLMTRPVAYYWESCTDDQLADGACDVAPGNVGEILGIGNPGVWWPALGAYLVVAWFALRHRDWRAWTLLIFLFGQYLPWLASPRALFFFYLTPAVPFVCLSLAFAAQQSLRRPLLRWVPAVLAGVAVAGFVFWYPVYSGQEIARSAWELRIWVPSWV